MVLKSSTSTCLVFMAALAVPGRAASISAVEFDGSTYNKAYESQQQVEPFVEFTQPGETVDSWTKLLSFRWYPEDAHQPSEAARRLAARVDASSSGADALVSEDPDGTEATVHFMAMENGSNTVEVDAFKYGLAIGDRGLVAVQFAFRFTIGKTRPADVKSARQRAVAAIKRFDLGQARAYFQR